MFVVALGLAGPVWADGPVDEAGALVFYEKGIALEAEGKWAKAEEQFVESLKRHERPRTAAHLGRVQVEQGKFVEGATNIEWFFKEDTEVPLDKKEGARQPLVVAQKNVGTLKLNIEPIDAVITIDGQVVPTNRRAWPHYVTPKSPHTVEVKKEGFVTKSETWTLVAGAEKLVKITLEPARVEAASGKGKVVGPVKPKPMPMMVKGAWIAGGVFGAVAIGTAIGAIAVTENAAAAEDKAQDVEDKGRGLCGQGTACFREYENGWRPLGVLAWTATTSTVLAGGFAAVALVLDKRSQKATGNYAMVPMFRPGNAGLVFLGVW